MDKHHPTWAAKRSNNVGSSKVGTLNPTLFDSLARALLASFLRGFVEHAKAARPQGYYCAICPFSSGGNIIQKKLDPVPRVNSCPGGRGGGAFAAVLSLIVVIKFQRLLKSSR